MRQSDVEPSGAKSYVFWALVGLLCLLAWANMVLTAVILTVLRLGHGMESMEVVPGEGVVKFKGDVDLGHVLKPDGKFDGLKDDRIEVKGVKGPAIFEVEDGKGRLRNSLILELNGTHFKGVKSFQVGSVFGTDSPNYKILQGARNVQAKVASASRVTGPINEKFVLRSDGYTKLKGTEGTRIEGKEILWTADQEVRLKSINGSIILNGKGGISLDVKNIPIVSKGLGGFLAPQYKICVCMPEGKMFRVPVSKDSNSQVACYNIDVSPDHNPCI